MALSRVHSTAKKHEASTGFATRYIGQDQPAKYELGERSMSSKAAAQIIKDECLLDGNPTMNLASFVTTWMEDEGDELLMLGRNKNIADQEQYPASNEIQERCINILASLFNSPNNGSDSSEEAAKKAAAAASEVGDDSAASSVSSLHNGSDDQHSVGTSTVGSSEAIVLAGLAMKWRWRQWRAKRAQEAEESKKKEQQKVQSADNAKDAKSGAGVADDKAASSGMLKGEGWATSAVLANKSYGPGSGEPPCNLIISAASHVSLLKTCKYLDIEPRIIPLAKGRYTLDEDLVMDAVDENTIGVMCILGNTLTGAFDPIDAISNRLIAFNKQHGTDIAIHVDGASGAFVAPFSYPELRVDFRVERVKSINVSGHKYGMVYPGLGWILWREKKDLPEDLIFHVNYLGADEPTYGLNFSKPAAQILCQYYALLRLGREGFNSIISRCQANAKYIAQQLLKTGVVEIVSENLLKNGHTIPVVVWRLKPDPALRRLLLFDERELVHELRTRGWIVPAYSLPHALEDMIVIRIVVRESLSHETCDLLLHDIKTKLVELIKRSAKMQKQIKRQIKMDGRIAQAQSEANAAATVGQKPAVPSAEQSAGEQALSPSPSPSPSPSSSPDEMDSEEDRLESHARAELIAQILGAIAPERPHTRMHGNVEANAAAAAASGKHGVAGKVVSGLASAVRGGLHAVGLVGGGAGGEEESKAGKHIDHHSHHGWRKLMDAVDGRASSVHTGAAGSAHSGKTKHITSVIC